MYNTWKVQEKPLKETIITNDKDYIKEITKTQEIINERGNVEIVKTKEKVNLTKMVNETAKLLKTQTLQEKFKNAFKEK